MNTDPKTKNMVTFPALDLHQFVCLSLFKEQKLMYSINLVFAFSFGFDKFPE